MTRKTVFINMGFDPTASLDIISTLSLASGDQLVLVYPQSTEEYSRLRSEQARTQVKNYVNTLRTLGRDIGYRELELNLNDLESAILSLLDDIISAKKKNYKTYFELTGGTRTITILMTLISIWFADYVDEITFVVEVTRERYNLPAISPLQVKKNHMKRILATLSSTTSIKRKELCEILGVSQSSVSRAVSELKKAGLVEEELRVISLSERFKILRPFFKYLPTD